MRINIYDENLQRIVIVGEQYVSCLWSEGYNTTEKFMIELQATDEIKKKVKVGCFVGRDDMDTMMVIKSVEYKDKKIIASGEQASAILDDLVFMGTIEADKNSRIDVVMNNSLRGMLNKQPNSEKVNAKFGVEFGLCDSEGHINGPSVINTNELKAKEWGSPDYIYNYSEGTVFTDVLKDTSKTASIQFWYEGLSKMGTQFPLVAGFTTEYEINFILGKFAAKYAGKEDVIAPKIEFFEGLDVYCDFYGVKMTSGKNTLLEEKKIKVPFGKIISATNVDSSKVMFYIKTNDEMFMNKTLPINPFGVRQFRLYTEPFLISEAFEMKPLQAGLRNIVGNIGFDSSNYCKCFINQTLYKDTTVAEHFVFDIDDSLNETVNSQMSDASFKKMVERYTKDTDLGFRVVKKEDGSDLINGRLEIGLPLLHGQFYKPKEKPENVLSEEYGNVIIKNTLDSIMGMKNYAIIKGKDFEDGTSNVFVLDRSDGKKKHPIIIDARDTEDPYVYIPRTLEKLEKEHKKIKDVSFDISEAELKEKFKLGDIITVRSPQFGFILKSRIVRFTQVIKENTVDTTVEVGNIVFTKGE